MLHACTAALRGIARNGSYLAIAAPMPLSPEAIEGHAASQESDLRRREVSGGQVLQHLPDVQVASNTTGAAHQGGSDQSACRASALQNQISYQPLKSDQRQGVALSPVPKDYLGAAHETLTWQCKRHCATPRNSAKALN